MPLLCECTYSDIRNLGDMGVVRTDGQFSNVEKKLVSLRLLRLNYLDGEHICGSGSLINALNGAAVCLSTMRLGPHRRRYSR